MSDSSLVSMKEWKWILAEEDMKKRVVTDWYDQQRSRPSCRLVKIIEVDNELTLVFFFLHNKTRQRQCSSHWQQIFSPNKLLHINKFSSNNALHELNETVIGRILPWTKSIFVWTNGKKTNFNMKLIIIIKIIKKIKNNNSNNKKIIKS